MANENNDQQFIRQLAALLDENGLTEIEVETAERRVKIARQGVVVRTDDTTSKATTVHQAEKTKDLSVHPGAVPSPMVGTVYRAPEPGARHYVDPGDQIKKGEIIMMIEAMKTFNEIKSPKDGIVKDILIEDGMPVEFGEVLAIIE